MDFWGLARQLPLMFLKPKFFNITPYQKRPKSESFQDFLQATIRVGALSKIIWTSSTHKQKEGRISEGPFFWSLTLTSKFGIDDNLRDFKALPTSKRESTQAVTSVAQTWGPCSAGRRYCTLWSIQKKNRCPLWHKRRPCPTHLALIVKYVEEICRPEAPGPPLLSLTNGRWEERLPVNKQAWPSDLVMGIHRQLIWGQNS